MRPVIPPLSIDIVTPVYNAGDVLRCCIQSVGDQGIGVRHYIQDGRSTDDATRAVLAEFADLVVSAPDSGMYDALNHAIVRGSGDVIGHLNADEQYLSGVLSFVRSEFLADPGLDVLCGDMVVVDSSWEPLSYRVSVRPPSHSAGLIPLAIPTCTLFFRRSLLHRLSLEYRTDLKALADIFFIEHLCSPAVKWKFVRKPIAAFSIQKNNLSASNCVAEDVERMGLQNRKLSRLWKRGVLWLTKLWAGAYISRRTHLYLYDEASRTRQDKGTRRLTWRHPKFC